MITAEFPRQYSLTHRDFLGALMNLGLRREAIGDILVEEGRAVLFLWETVADLVLSELAKAGRVGLKLTEGLPEQLPAAHAFQEIAGTAVSYTHLDVYKRQVDKVALANPQISFRFIRDGQVKLNTPGNDDLRSVIYAVYGKEFAEGMIPVSYTHEFVSVNGFICRPTASRSTRSMQSFFINSRYVRSRTCMAALAVSYTHLACGGVSSRKCAAFYR